MTATLSVSPTLCDRNLPHDARQSLFGGQGVVRVWSLATTPALPFTAVLACELDPSGSVGTHVQEQYPEIVIAIAGRGIVRVNDEPVAFEAGRVVELALGHTLAITNASNTEPLLYLIIKARA